MSPEEQYREYLTGHIGNVSKALEILYTLDIPYVKEHIDELREIVKKHDASKYEEPEWSAYLHHFYPKNDDEEKMGEEFDVAVNHHIKNNKHHWNYWCDDENNLKDDIDEEEYKLYTIERICDWLAMGAQHGEGPSAYWNLNKEYVIEPDYAKEMCDEIFNMVPEDYAKDMWKVNRGELDEGESIASLIGGGRGDSNRRVKKWFTLDTKMYFPSWGGGRITYYFCFNDACHEAITYSKKLYDYIEKGYKYLIEYTPCSIPWKSRTAGVIISMRNLKVLDKVPLEKVNEDILPMNKEVVDSLGDRVKRSKTSNTIEIDTQMTNHDKQLKEEMSVDKKKEVLPKLIQDANTDETNIIETKLKQLGYTDINNAISNLNNDNSEDIENTICNVLHKDKEEYLTEMKLSQIKQKSRNQDPERINRSRKVKTTYLGMSKFGILNFKTTSQSRNGYHYQTIEFKDMKPFEDIIKSGNKIMPDDIKKNLQNQDVNVWCTDESFAYWAWAHQAYKYDFLYIDDRIPNLKKAIQAPKVNNVRLNGGACKHILSVIDYCTRPFVLLAISDDMNKYLEGNKEDKMQKQPLAVQNQYDMVAQWDWSEMEEYLGLSRVEIMADLAKTIQIIPSIDKGDVLTDIVGEAVPEEDQGMKRQVVDKLEDLINNEKNS